MPSECARATEAAHSNGSLAHLLTCSLVWAASGWAAELVRRAAAANKCRGDNNWLSRRFALLTVCHRTGRAERDRTRAARFVSREK